MKTLDDLLATPVRGQRVLVRSILNAPIDNGRIVDDTRIRASVPVIKALSDAGARVVVAAHLGRPKGTVVPELSLRPVAQRLSELLDRDVAFATDTVGESAHATVKALADGDVALLENVRFEAAETSKDDKVRAAHAQQLAELADSYVLDALGDAHRKQASVYDVVPLLPHYAGWLLAGELDVLKELTSSPKSPYVVVLGGAKVSDKLAVLHALLPNVDRLLVGGGMCYTFLKAAGHQIGGSLVEDEMVDDCRQMLATYGERIVLPVDVVVADRIADDVETRVVPADAIPADQKGLDIGPLTIGKFTEIISTARTVFWNGPLGVFEFSPFVTGTKDIGQAIADCPGVTVVGGGDSAAAVRQLGLDESAYTHISTGGGASLEILEGKTLPGVAALEA